MNFLEKLQNLPEQKKKIILWISVGLITFFLLIWYFKAAQSALQGSKSRKLFEGELQIPQLKERIKETFKQVGPKKEEFEGVKEKLKGLIEEAKEKSTKLDTSENE